MNDESQSKDFMNMPDERGHFGPYGGRFVSETLMEAIDELTEAYEKLHDIIRHCHGGTAAIPRIATG